MTALAPSIAPAVRDYLTSELALSPFHECLFTCEWDAATRTITRATLLHRGRPESVFVISTDHKPGTMALHNHPASAVMPSENDAAAAQALGAEGVGFAIIDNLATTLFVVREPRYAWQFLEPVPRRTKSWFWWRFMLVYMSPLKKGASQ
jgi:hypothetical protein